MRADLQKLKCILVFLLPGPPIQLALHDHWKRRMGALITLAGRCTSCRQLRCDAYDATDAQVDMTNGWMLRHLFVKSGPPSRRTAVIIDQSSLVRIQLQGDWWTSTWVELICKVPLAGRPLLLPFNVKAGW